ncbi:TadE/TadG family type IV pilus assembly protein [Tropicimonas sediminicola]|nr:TadE/TadG family type IV pilus assembly protein [Tropicimonas sediminicola]
MTRRFLKSERGSVTIEFVMWLPFFAFLLLFAADASLVFMRQSQMWQVSRETARVIARHGMDELTAETYAASAGSVGTLVPTVDVSMASARVTVDMAMPLEGLAPFGVLRWIYGEQLEVRVTHALEPTYEAS